MKEVIDEGDEERAMHAAETLYVDPFRAFLGRILCDYAMTLLLLRWVGMCDVCAMLMRTLDITSIVQSYTFFDHSYFLPACSF